MIDGGRKKARLANRSRRGKQGHRNGEKRNSRFASLRLSFFLPRLPARSQGGGSRACRDVARGRRDGEREAREARRKRRACPAVEKEKNVRWLSSSARRKEEAEGRALSALYLRFYAQPPRQAPRRRCQRGHRGRERRNERGKEEEKAAGLVCIVAPTLTTERWNASSLSTLLNTQKIALTRRSTVPGWKVPLRLPLRKGRWRRVG